MMKYLIRKAQKEDAAALHTIICRLEEADFKIADFTYLYEKNINNKQIIYLAAVNAEQEIIGFISAHLQLLLHHCGRVAEIQELFVDPAYRNVKIGSALLNEIEKLLQGEGCIQVEVTANIKRNTAHAFYMHAGFVETHKKFVKHFV
jgi:PhnO protein